MPVYNGEKFLRESINSILNQTYTNFEFIIIDDGSKDSSVEIIKGYKDKRIKFYRNHKNKGLPYTLNRGIDLSRGKYIARMDHDDVSLTYRLEKQVTFMEDNPEIDICGSAIVTEFKGTDKIFRQPSHHEEIKATLLFKNAMAHPTIVMRKKSMVKCGLLYDPLMVNAEDYELWTRVCWSLKMANIYEPLLNYRRHNNQMVARETLRPAVCLARKKFVSKFVNRLNEDDWNIHCMLTDSKIVGRLINLNKLENWILKLSRSNERLKLVERDVFMSVLESQWFNYCLKICKLRPLVFIKYTKSPLSRSSPDYWKRFIYLAIRTIF
jgi:glycosyltransferase involved in cell wall biosynthesis